MFVESFDGLRFGSWFLAVKKPTSETDPRLIVTSVFLMMREVQRTNTKMVVVSPRVGVFFLRVCFGIYWDVHCT